MRAQLNHNPARKQVCPNCNLVINSAAGIDDKASPEPGGFTICIGCHSIWRFGDAMDLEEPTNEEKEIIYKENKALFEHLKNNRFTIVKVNDKNYRICHACGDTTVYEESMGESKCLKCGK